MGPPVKPEGQRLFSPLPWRGVHPLTLSRTLSASGGQAAERGRGQTSICFLSPLSLRLDRRGHLTCGVFRGPAGASDRDLHQGAEAAEGAFEEQDVAAMAAGDIAGDGETEAGAGAVLVAGFIEAVEGAERVFHLVDVCASGTG